MQRMITQVLDLTRARLTSGIPLALSERPLALDPIVGKIVDEVLTANPGATIDVRVEGDCSALLDTDRFEQVVSNLLGNAVVHGDRARPIRVLLRAHANEVSMTVENQGAPIDPALLPLLFNPFARGHKPRGASEGLGLGLYISERIVDAHGGRLTVQSTEASGTQFEVTLPRRPS